MASRKPDRRGLPRGWDAKEPGSLLLALLLLTASAVTPWWGFQMDTSSPPYTSSRGVDFGPWLGEEWRLQILPGNVHRPSDTRVWWDFVSTYPQYAGYASLAPLLLALWGVALTAALLALATRAKAQRRMGGWPTVAEGVALGASVAAALVGALGFPAVAGFPGFYGAAGDVSWGPRVGWFLLGVGAAFLGLATWFGWRTDRALRGLCWKCFREVSGKVCGYCEAVQ